MSLLLDTHAFLWFVLNDSQITEDALAAIIEATDDVFLSPASYWEIAIKVRIGKLSLAEDFLPFMESQLEENNFRILPISLRHAAIVATLPLYHRDPFDRLLLSQAIAEDIPLISRDEVFDRYGVQRIW